MAAGGLGSRKGLGLQPQRGAEQRAALLRAVKTIKGDLANLPIFIDEGNQGPEVTQPVCGVARTGSLAHYCSHVLPRSTAARVLSS